MKRRVKIFREIDHEKLGLSHMQFLVRFPPHIDPLLDYPNGSLVGPWEDLYTSTIYRSVPDGMRLIVHLLPLEMHDQLRKFYSELEALGIVKVHDTYNCSRLLHPRMWIDEYDFDKMGWGPNWISTKRQDIKVELTDHPISQAAPLDKEDLLILKEMQINSNQRLVDVAAKIRLNQSTLFWHWRDHILKRRLFRGWRLNWLGTFIDSKLGGFSQRRAFAGFDVVAKGLSPIEMTNLRNQLHTVPYLWAEEVGSEDYIGELFIPIHLLMDGFEFIGKIVRPLEERARVLVQDYSSATNYTIHPHLFDETKGWTFRGEQVLDGVRKILPKVSDLSRDQ